VTDKADDFIQERLEELRQEKKEAKQKENESDKPAPAKKRGQRKSHVEKLEEQRSPASKSQ